jgi:hypothetical protein
MTGLLPESRWDEFAQHAELKHSFHLENESRKAVVDRLRIVCSRVLVLSVHA